MHEKCVNEFCAAHMHGFCSTAIGVILVVEYHAGVIHGSNLVVADSTAEYITGKIDDSVAGSVKCFLDMWDPVLVIKPVYKFLPFITLRRYRQSP